MKPFGVSLKALLIAAFVAGSSAGWLMGNSPVRAQDTTQQEFMVQVGGSGPGNVDLLAFAPQSLQVHQGDTVTFVTAGFHNVRFGNDMVPSVIMTELDGQAIPAFNPEIVLRNTESGEVFSGGNVNSGMPQPGASPVWSLVIDAEPGTYAFLCDIHPGMAGVLTVVDDSVAIPSPAEVAEQGAAELMSALNSAFGAGLDIEAQSLTAVNDDNSIQMGSANTGRATVNQFFPFSLVIEAGESVTWVNPEASVEPHLVSWPPVRGQDVQVIEVEGQPPIFGLGPTLAPMTPTESTVQPGEAFGSGLVMPGTSYTLTFAEPGVYPFTCNIHPAMNGVVVVEPAS